LAQLIEPRVEEIFELAKKEIQGSGYYGLLPMGVALTGGSVLLPGTAEVASRILDTPSRVEAPRGVGGMLDSVSSPVYSTSVGLVKYAAAQRGNSRDNGRSPNLLTSMVTGIRRLFR
jgi:cell division protein FtsA